MKLYHGSPIMIPRPELKRGKLSNDYGQGFYCTESLEMAKEWACKGKEPPAFANVYELDMKGLKVLDLSKPPYTILNWIAILLANRTFELDLETAQEVRDFFLANFLPPVSTADVVIGYRADDSYFNYALTFVNNGLSLARLNEALRLGKLGLQVALRTEKSFANLKFIEAQEANWPEYHRRYVKRDTSAREEWQAIKKSKETIKDAVFAYDIIRMGLKPDDERLSTIIPA